MSFDISETQRNLPIIKSGSLHLVENLVPFEAEPDEDETYTLLIDP